MAEQKKSPRLKGWIFLSLWAVLIITGIVVKRGMGHPDLIVFFHLPAAVCLVIASHNLSRDFRARYKQTLAERSSRLLKYQE